MFMQLLVGSLCGNCFTYPDSARCRQWMHDVVHSSELTVLGEADLRALPSALPESSAPPNTDRHSLFCVFVKKVGCQFEFVIASVSNCRAWQGFEERNSLPQDYIHMIDRCALQLRQRPLCLHRAADALLNWVHNTQLLQAPLDVSACDMIWARSMPSQRLFAPVGAGDGCPLGLEPAVSVVSIQGLHAAMPGEKGSDEAHFVYPFAFELVQEHSFQLCAAIGVARKCWSRLSAQRRVDIAHFVSVEEVDEIPMQLEPER